MKTKFYSLAGVLALAAAAANAQTQYDAARLSGSELNGTARFVGMGGAMSALGADMSTMATNPAGIGLFRGHDVSVSFGFNKNLTTSTLNGTQAEDERTKASFDQAGFVYSTKIGNRTSLRYFNVGFNYHKVMNFNRQFSSAGNLNGSSMSWQMQDMLVGTGAYQSATDFNALLDAQNPYTSTSYYGTPFLGMMGARTGLVDGVSDTDGSNFSLLGWNGLSGQYYSREEGSINAYDFNVAFNVKDRFYFGLTLGVYDVNYSRYSSYGENVLDDNGEDNGSFELNNWYSTDGTGFDLKLGMIIRPFEYSPFRIGLAIHTPIWYSLDDRYTATLNSDILYMPESYTENLTGYLGSSGSYLLESQLHTPWKFNLSMGTTVSNVLALGAEYEFSNYAHAKYKDLDGYDLTAINEANEKYLKNVHTVRLGMEAKLSPFFSLRAGYNYQTSPFKDNSARYVPDLGTNPEYIYYDETRTDPEYHNLKARHTATFGLGFKTGRFYADVAYKYDFYKSDFYMFDDYQFSDDGYSIEGRNAAASVDHNRHQLLLTLGMRF